MSEKRTIESTGVDVEAAIAAGLKVLGVERDAVEVQVLDEGRRGVLGVGAREARVRLAVSSPVGADLAAARPTSPEREQAEGGDEAEIARAVLSDILALMDIKGAAVSVREPSDEKMSLVLNIHGPGTDVLIGRQGQVLAALQYITRMAVSQKTARRSHVIVDVEGFRERREKMLRGLAKRMAEQAVRTNRTVVLEPMPPYERRIIHLTLRGHPGVTTESVGEGERRKVTIIPR